MRERQAAQQREGESGCNVGGREKERQAAQQLTESRERASSGREWRKKLNSTEAVRKIEAEA